MSLWQLETTRLIRTSRWLVLLGVYALFGAIGPVTARYMDAIFERFATGEISITLGDPRPVDGMVQFITNASQIGLLAVIVVAAAALALDARPELAAFLRTRISSPWQLVLPRYIVVTLAAMASLIVGTALAAGLTTSLIGALPLRELAIGTAYGALYIAFATAVVAAAAGFAKTQLTTVFAAIVVLLALPLLALIDPLSPWLPSTLMNAIIALIDGTAPTEFLRAATVTLIATAALLALGVKRATVREL